jgi:hypothetical protein
MATVLEELGVLHLTRPGLGASDAEVAAWHERRAVMLEHAATTGDIARDVATGWAASAHHRAAQRRGQLGAVGAVA